MKRKLFLSLSLIISVSLVSGFALSRGGSHQVVISVHTKDLPEEGLTLIGPAHPNFEAMFADRAKANRAIEASKLYSVFLRNDSQQSVVAYMIQWCLTRADGKNIYYRKTYSSSMALMEGEHLSEDVEARTDKVKAHSAILLSCFSSDGSGPLGVPIPSSAEEVQRMKNGVNLDQADLLRRANLELAKYTDVTVTVDGAFFEDGTFVGEDACGFFAQMKAQVDARRDLLNELAAESTKTGKSKENVYKRVEGIVQQEVNLSVKSSPDDYYRYYRKFYAQQILRRRDKLGDEQALAHALAPTKKTWPLLVKKQPESQ